MFCCVLQDDNKEHLDVDVNDASLVPISTSSRNYLTILPLSPQCVIFAVRGKRIGKV